MIKSKTTYRLIQLLGLVCSGIGMLTIAGYIAGKPGMYTWSGDMGMALNTAIVFVLIGIALYVIGERLKRIHHIK